MFVVVTGVEIGRHTSYQWCFITTNDVQSGIHANHDAAGGTLRHIGDIPYSCMSWQSHDHACLSI